MCQPISLGGKRCAAHTRPQFMAIVAALDSTNKFTRGKILLGQTHATKTHMMEAIDYASTDSGQGTDKGKDKSMSLPVIMAKYRAEGDVKTANWMAMALAKGKEKKQIDAQVTKTIQDAAAKAKRKETLSKSPLSRSKAKKRDGILSVKYPDAAAMWHPTKNVDHKTGEVLAANQVDGGSNADVFWQCDKCGYEWTSRCNNTTAAINRGTALRCGNCTGRRSRSLKNMQQHLANFVTAVDNDPEAWESLSQVARYQILSENGMLTAGGNSFTNATALSMIHGDVTLSDVMDAQDAEALDRAVAMEGVSDNDETAKTIDFATDTPTGDTAIIQPDDQDVRIDRVMAATGTLGLINSNTVLAEQITRETFEKLWDEIHKDETKVEEVLAKIEAGSSKNQFRAQIAADFEADLRRVQGTPLPDGYNNIKTLRDGTQIEMNPTLAQRRYALNVEESRVHANWSLAGAGKTLAAVVAVGHIEAQESLVVCPQPLIGQWKAEFERAFPDTEIRTDFPKPGEDLDATRDGRRRVWVLNYEKFATAPKKGEPSPAELMAPLADRLEAAILDEVHKAKSTDPKTESRRRKTLDSILEQARQTNPELAVMPTTATPVVTSLEEAKSILRLAYGKDNAPAMGTKATLKNAAAAYHAMSAAGTRGRPAYKPTLERAESSIDITDNMPNVVARMDRLAERHVAYHQTKYDAMSATEKKEAGPFNPEKHRRTALSLPSTMERALLPERLPVIVEKVRAANGPSVIYTQYSAGMVKPIADELESKGFRTAQFTGSMSTTEKAEAMRKFESGEVDVLVGTSALGTGVDGLQRRSANMIVASMPWTAADDDQLVGRLHRVGQTDNVTVDYLMTEVNLGAGQKWSYCKGRKNRIEYRRSLADAAIDGKMPDGQLGKESDQVTAAAAKMREIVAANQGFAQAA